MSENIAFAFAQIATARDQRGPQQLSDRAPTILFRQDQSVSFVWVSQRRICAGLQEELTDGCMAARGRNHQGGGSVVIGRIDVTSPPKVKGNSFLRPREKRRPEHGTQSSPIKLLFLIHTSPGAQPASLGHFPAEGLSVAYSSSGIAE
jgi:hypothetical protein